MKSLIEEIAILRRAGVPDSQIVTGLVPDDRFFEPATGDAVRKLLIRAAMDKLDEPKRKRRNHLIGAAVVGGLGLFLISRQGKKQLRGLGRVDDAHTDLAKSRMDEALFLTRRAWPGDKQMAYEAIIRAGEQLLSVSSVGETDPDFQKQLRRFNSFSKQFRPMAFQIL